RATPSPPHLTTRPPRRAPSSTRSSRKTGDRWHAAASSPTIGPASRGHGWVALRPARGHQPGARHAALTPALREAAQRLRERAEALLHVLHIARRGREWRRAFHEPWRSGVTVATPHGSEARPVRGADRTPRHRDPRLSRAPRRQS